MREVCDALRQAAKRLRITRLRENRQIEAPVLSVLRCLGELKRPFLTQFEEKLLSFIQQECEGKD